jgi:hypothetical protein
MPRAARSELPEAAGQGRLVFLDVLRVLVISMVIIHHVAQAYGPTGGFWPVRDAATSEWFRPFYTVNAAVGLGMLFLIAGYFYAGLLLPSLVPWETSASTPLFMRCGPGAGDHPSRWYARMGEGRPGAVNATRQCCTLGFRDGPDPGKTGSSVGGFP